MESLNTLKNAATKAIWGEETTTTIHQEPIAGKTGDTAKGEPYDAGNMEPEQQSALAVPTPQATTSSNPMEKQPKEQDHHHQQPQQQDSEPPNKTLPSSTAPTDTTPSQSDTRHPSDPGADHHASAPRRDVDNHSGLDVDDHPDKALSGPGPRPLEVVAKEHGGDAGRSGIAPGEKSLAAETSAASSTSSSSAASSSSSEAELERHDSGHDAGSGEGYVKSSGLRADGGDFDASKPGAGREADRLLELKGVHRDPAANGGVLPNKGVDMDAVGRLNASGIAGSGPAPKEKKSLKKKIKDKLRRSSGTEATA